MRQWKRILSLFLALMMCLSLLPVSALAEGEETAAEETEALCTHDYVATVTEPTCTEGGFTTYTCALCGDSYTADETEALGHTPQDVPEVPAEPGVPGTAAGVVCAVCGAVLEGCEPLPPLDEAEPAEEPVPPPEGEQTLQDLLDAAAAGEDFTLTDSLSVPKDVDVVFAQGKTLTVESGATLELELGSRLQTAMEIRGQVIAGVGSEVNIEGWLYFGDKGFFTIDSGAEVSIPGWSFIAFQQQNHIQLNGDDSQTLGLSFGGDFHVTRDVTFARRTRPHILPGATLTVESGALLTIEGDVNLEGDMIVKGAAEIVGGCTVIASDERGLVTVEEGGVLTVYGQCLSDLQINGLVALRSNSNYCYYSEVHFGENGLMTADGYAYVGISGPNFLDEQQWKHIQLKGGDDQRLHMTFFDEYTATGDVTFARRTRPVFAQNSRFVIPEGVTVDVLGELEASGEIENNGVLNLRSTSCDQSWCGSLINNGTVNLYGSSLKVGHVDNRGEFNLLADDAGKKSVLRFDEYSEWNGNKIPMAVPSAEPWTPQWGYRPAQQQYNLSLPERDNVHGIFTFYGWWEQWAARYDVKIYRTDTVDPLYETSLRLAAGEFSTVSLLRAMSYDWGSGDYYYTVQAISDGDAAAAFADSPVYTSEVWSFTSPGIKFRTPARPAWIGDSTTVHWAPVQSPALQMYWVNVSWSETEDGEPTGETLYLTWADKTEADLGDIVRGQGGPGWYRARVRAITDDILVAADSDWSAYSEARWFDYDSSAFEELRTACREHAEYLDLRNRGVVTITEPIEIPAGTFVNAEGTTLVILPDIKLTVNGDLIAEEIDVRQTQGPVVDLEIGGWVSVGTLRVDGVGEVMDNARLIVNRSLEVEGLFFVDDTWIDLNYKTWSDELRDRMNVSQNGGVHVHFEARNEADIEFALNELPMDDNIRSNVHVRFDWTPTKDFWLPEGMNFHFARETAGVGTLTVPEGVSVYVYGGMNVVGTDVTVKGMLMNASGHIVLNSAQDARGKTVAGRIVNQGVFIGTGELIVCKPLTLKNVLVGLTPAQFTLVHEDENESVWVPADGTFHQLKRAIGQGEDFNAQNDLPVTISENLTVPENVNVNCWSSKLIVPKGVTLTIEGSATFATAQIDGTVYVRKHGSFAIEGDGNTATPLVTGSAGLFKVEGRDAQAMVPLYSDVSAVRRQLLDGAQMRVHAQARSTYELTEALRDFRAAYGNNDDFRAYIEVLNTCELDADLEIPANATVYAIEADVDWGTFTGGLIVPAGVTLTVNGEVGLHNALLLVLGDLVNNGHFDLNRAYGWYGDCGKIDCSNMGSYAGYGNVWVHNPHDADGPDPHFLGTDTSAFDIFTNNEGTNYRLIESYELHYNLSGGQGEIPAAVYGLPFASAYTPVLPGDPDFRFDRPGYEFVGWRNYYNGMQYTVEQLRQGPVQLNIQLNPDGTPYYDENGKLVYTNYVELGAMWEQIRYTVEFEPNGATEENNGLMPLSTGWYGDAMTAADLWLAPVFEAGGLWRTEYEENDQGFRYDGYVFTGWNTQPDGSGRAYNPNPMGTQIYFAPNEQHLTLYAQWAPESEYERTYSAYVESGKKLDLAKELTALTGERAVSWTVVSGGEFATVTNKGALTAKAVTEGHTVEVVAVTATGKTLFNVIVCPTATMLELRQVFLDDQGVPESYVVVSQDTIYLDVGERLCFDADITPYQAWWGNFSVTMSDKGKFVTLTQTGSTPFDMWSVEGVAAGTATMTVSIGKLKQTVKLVVGKTIQNVQIKCNAEGRPVDAKGNPLFQTWVSNRTGYTFPAVRGGTKLTFLADYDTTVKYSNTDLVWEMLDWHEEYNDWGPMYDTSYASLSEKGVLTTKTVSEVYSWGVRVYVKAAPWICSDVFEFAIAPSVQSVSLATSGGTGLAVGGSMELYPTVLPSRAIGELEWKLSPAGVVDMQQTPSGALRLTGLKPGTVTVTATAKDGSKKSASVKLTVDEPTPVSIQRPAKAILAAGEKLTLTANLSKLTWTSSNPNALTVTAKGQVTAKKLAESMSVRITATAPNGTSDSVWLTVEKARDKDAVVPVQRISISGAHSLLAGEKLTLKATITAPKKPTNKTLVWASSDPSVATVSAKGEVTAMPVEQQRDVYIVAYAADQGGAYARVRITVFPKGLGMGICLYEDNNDVTGLTQTVDLSENVWIRAYVYPGGIDAPISWKSSNANIATVKNETLVFGGKTGVVTLTASTTDGSKLSASVKLNVVKRVTGVSIKTGAGYQTIRPGAKLDLAGKNNANLIFDPADATDKSVTWWIDPINEGYATVTAKGTLTAKKVTDAHIVRVWVASNDNPWATAWTDVYIVPAGR